MNNSIHAMNLNQIRCDVCGRFISLADFESGRANRSMTTPDSDLSCEEWETLCRLHYMHIQPNKSPGMGPTPRTDLEVDYNEYGIEIVVADFARGLERELAAERAKVAELVAALENLKETALIDILDNADECLDDYRKFVRRIARAALARAKEASK